MSAPALPRSRPWRDDARTIGLVGLAHGTSHFFHLLLPPLFPWLIRDFGLSYAQMGALMSVFFLVSGLGQALAGFVVDRLGARPVLLVALSCFVLAALAAAAAPGYGALLAAAALAGLGNAPFHPVDFSILNHRVSPLRLGHAFSVHGISGNLGWAAAPLVLTGVTVASGSWRLALLLAAGLAASVLALLSLQREALEDRPLSPPRTGRPPVGNAGAMPTRPAPAVAADGHPLAFLKLPAVWLSFLFFFWTTCALSSIQGFAAPALHRLYGLPEASAALVVSGYMLAGAAGMVAGGFLMTRMRRLERLIAACLLGAAALLAAVGLGWVPTAGAGTAHPAGGAPVAGWVALAMISAAGFGAGLAGPSRDMLVKRAAPPGATGRVYGAVYSGLDLGFAVAAPVFGLLMDRSAFGGVFLGAAAALVVGVACASGVGARVARTRDG